MVRTGPISLIFLSPTFVQVYWLGVGLAAVTSQVKDNVSPTIVLWSDIGCILGRSVSLGKIIFVVYQMQKQHLIQIDNRKLWLIVKMTTLFKISLIISLCQMHYNMNFRL